MDELHIVMIIGGIMCILLVSTAIYMFINAERWKEAEIEKSPYITYTFNGKTEECKRSWNSACGLMMDHCRSGKEYSCLTNVEVGP